MKSETNNLPEKYFEHGVVLQSRSTASGPMQDDDPLANLPVVQLRCCSWNPVPQT